MDASEGIGRVDRVLGRFLRGEVPDVTEIEDCRRSLRALRERFEELRKAAQSKPTTRATQCERCGHWG